MSLVALPAATPDSGRRARDAEAAFEALFRAHAPRVKALAERRLTPRHTADDVVQETFLRALRSLHTLDPDRPVWPWLRTVANNVCIDMVRQSRRARDDAEYDEQREVPSGDASSDPSEAHLASERRVTIAAALAAVNVRQRRVLVLRDIEGWDTESVAELEGVSVDAVKSTLKRGRQVFRSHYMALAAPNGLLGTVVALGGALFAVARRLGQRARAAEAYRIGGIVPIAQVVPLALVLTLAGGALGAYRESLQQAEERSTTITPDPRLAAAQYDAVASLGVGDGAAHASAAATPPAAAGPASSSTRISPSMPTGDAAAVGAGVARTPERVLVSVDASITAPGSGNGIVAHASFACDRAVRAMVCDTSDATWSAAQAAVPATP